MTGETHIIGTKEDLCRDLFSEHFGNILGTPKGDMKCTGVQLLEGEILMFFEDRETGIAESFYFTELNPNGKTDV